MTSFVAAMSAPDLTKTGVKGSDVYTEAGVGDARVALFTRLVRGLSAAEIFNAVESGMPRRGVCEESNEAAAIARDFAVMAFQTRDVRGGKGERDLFYHMIAAITRVRPEWTQPLLDLVPEYGCWRDLWALWKQYPHLQSFIDVTVKKQFELDQESAHPSLLVKWLPREGSKYDTLARHFAALLFPFTPYEKGGRMRMYRRTLAYLNKLVDTTEIKMCGRTWANITPSRVPGRLMKRCKLAFFNEKSMKLGRRTFTETRYPENKDREECAQNFRHFMQDVAAGKTTMKGGQTTMPHEHVHEILERGHMSNDAMDVIQAQWNAIRSEAQKGGGLSNMVAMCDFSGSMNGVPKEVSLALGILISELAPEAFRDHILTFDDTPVWHSFSNYTTLYDKVNSIGSLGQGLSTNFQAACDLVLKRLVEHKVAPEDAPKDLLVLTDMGFDAAAGYEDVYSHVKKTSAWETHFQMIRASFEAAGYTAPRIVCWNLRAEYNDYHATAHEKGVVQLSGWSPSVLKAIQGTGIQVETPYQGLRRLLDEPRYDAVREALSSKA